MPERNRGGIPALKVLATVVCLALAGLIVWWLLPNWIARPNAEATVSQYQDAADVPKPPEGSYYSTGGKCPALTMDVAKAMVDKKLTAGEAHALKNKAYELSKASTEASAKNRALEATGNKGNTPEIDCPNGLFLFNF